jgi:hypothetical protein
LEQFTDAGKLFPHFPFVYRLSMGFSGGGGFGIELAMTMSGGVTGRYAAAGAPVLPAYLTGGIISGDQQVWTNDKFQNWCCSHLSRKNAGFLFLKLH